MAGSCFYAFHQMGSTAGAVVTAVNVVLVVGLSIYVLRAKTWKRFSLDTKIDSKAVGETPSVVVGDKGRTVTRLSPVGMVRFGNIQVEAKALEGMIDPNVDVEVVLIEDGKMFVKPETEEY